MRAVVFRAVAGVSICTPQTVSPRPPAISTWYIGEFFSSTWWIARLSLPPEYTRTGLFWFPPEAAAAATSHQLCVPPTSVSSPRPSTAPMLPSGPRVPIRPEPLPPKVMNG
jgi:hypothetical protein